MGNATTTSVRLTGGAWAGVGADVFAFLPDKRHQLLAYLAHHGGWVSRDKLASLFWPEVPQGAARHNLRQLLVRTRALAFCDGLEVETHRLRWAVDTDLAAFAAALGDGRWQDALDRYGGPLLAGLENGDSGEFSAWLELERGRLHGQWRTAVLRRAEELTGAGWHLEAAELLQVLVEGDELDEAALGAYVGALVRAGGRERALLAYEAFVGRLREDLGLEPTAELERLARDLRGGKGLEPSGPVPVPAPAPSLPAGLTSFVGRDLELSEIERLLALPDCRLLTLVGPGGIGKTRLALEAAGRLSASYPDGVFFVPLDSLSSPDLIPASLADGLGLALQGQTDPLRQVIRFVGNRRVLVVLDNYEHLLEGAGHALELTRACPNLRLLVTSRERLGLPGEWLLPVEGLGYPSEAETDPIEGLYFDAVQLFLERARRVRPGFAPGPEDLPHLLAVCRLLEGSPLGLELAAVWVRVLPLGDIVREIGANLDFLLAGRGRAERHRSLRAAFEHSWRLLTEAEQEAFRKLSVFRGGFRLEAARLVAGATLPVLAALVDKSLLRVSPAGRYDRHALLYQYARELLAAHPEEETEAEARHGRYYLRFLASQGEEVQGPKSRAALAALDEEIENLRAAWGWAVDGSQVEELRQTGVQRGLMLHHDLRSRYQEGLAAFGEAGRALAGGEPALGEALTIEAWFAMRLGRYEEARRQAARGLALLPPDGPAAVHGLNALGAVAERSGDYAEAVRRFAEAAALAGQHGLTARRASLLSNLAWAEAARGRFGPAARHAEETLALYRGLGYPGGVVRGLWLLGSVAVEDGRLEEGRATLERGLAMAQEHGIEQEHSVRDILGNLARVALEQGVFEEAVRLAEKGLSLSRAAGSEGNEATGLCLLGRAKAGLGADQAALGHLERALRLASSIRGTPTLLEALVYLAELWIKQGRAREAATPLSLASRHPKANHRLKVLASRLLEGLRPRLSPAELAEAEVLGDPARLEALVDEVLAELASA